MFETTIKWHKASEELPERSCDVMVVTRWGYLSRVPYSAKNRAFNSTDDDNAENALPVELWLRFKEYKSQLKEIAADYCE